MWYLMGIMVAMLIFGGIFSIPEVRIAMSIKHGEVSDGELAASVLIMSLIWPLTLTLLLIDLTKPRS